jgi:cytidylate kinase
MANAARTGDPVPHHGDRGEAGRAAPRFPRTFTIAVSRQAGARGASIAGRVGRKLGWQVVDQEVLEYVAQQDPAEEAPSEAARAWADARISELRESGVLGGDGPTLAIARAVLALAAEGDVIVIGRGAGHILPRASTLHVRIVAPRADRVAYMGQHLRLTPAESEREVDQRDERRREYLLDHLNADSADPTHYDLTLNSSRLGEELCAELIAQAARGRMLGSDPAGPPDGT